MQWSQHMYCRTQIAATSLMWLSATVTFLFPPAIKTMLLDFLNPAIPHNLLPACVKKTWVDPPVTPLGHLFGVRVQPSLHMRATKSSIESVSQLSRWSLRTGWTSATHFAYICFYVTSHLFAKCTQKKYPKCNCRAVFMYGSVALVRQRQTCFSSLKCVKKNDSGEEQREASSHLRERVLPPSSRQGTSSLPLLRHHLPRLLHTGTPGRFIRLHPQYTLLFLDSGLYFLRTLELFHSYWSSYGWVSMTWVHCMDV